MYNNNESIESAKNVRNYSLDNDGDVRMTNVSLLLSRVQKVDDTIDIDDIKRAMGMSVEPKVERGHLLGGDVFISAQPKSGHVLALFKFHLNSSVLADTKEDTV